MTTTVTPNRRGFATPTTGLSGNAYVPARMRGYEHEGLHPIRVLTPARCDHLETICTDCAESWSWDWDIWWHRTAGGRRLGRQIVAITWASR
jgi:hypothetical protein